MSTSNQSDQSGVRLAHDPQVSALWERLRNFSFDHGDGPRTFARRLAEEQGWSAEFTVRAIEEYRRFLLLFALSEKDEVGGSSGPPRVRIVPSVTVDEVWHLHLLYTQSYWGTLCGEILRRPLHHQPADGSVGEAASLGDVYLANREAYRATFGQEPPADIWPEAGTLLAVHPVAAPGYPLTVAAVTLLAGAAAVVFGACLFAGWTPSGGSDLIQGLCVLCGVIFVAGLFLDGASARGGTPVGSRRTATRRRVHAGVTGGFWMGGDTGEVTVISVGSGGHHSHSSHSHGAHVGVSEGNGHSHACGGHSCGGHSCGGHGCGGH